MPLVETLISLSEWEERKKFVTFTADDEEALSWLRPMAEFFADEVVSDLYDILTRSDATKAFLTDESLVTGLKKTQTDYFIQLFAGNYGEEYLKNRLRIGEVHYKVGLPSSIYLATYTHYFMLIRPHIFEYLDNENDAFRVMDALAKLITLDETLAIDAYIEATVNQA